jgi:hypothetical protein
MSIQYFTNSEQTGFDDLVAEDIELIQTSSYNEEALSAKITETGLKKELFGCALQMALMGWGRGNYGSVNVGNARRDLVDVFDEAGVYYNNDPGTQLDPEDLTPKRLVRLFRFQIQKWIEAKQSQSFLLRKYGSLRIAHYSSYVFPGAEHLIEEKRHAVALLECYTELDRQQQSHFSDRIKTVFKTRKIAFE